MVIRKHYSTLFFAADRLASVEPFEGGDFRIECRETDELTFEMHARPGVHPVELKERMQTRRYDFKPGGIEYERCSRCGVPEQVARLEWMVEEGAIEDRESDRRMAFFAPHAVDNVLRDLEAELGDAIQGAVVEAQGRYVKSRIGNENWRRSGTTFNHLAALRGLGNNTCFDADEDDLRVGVQNSCMPLLVVGMAQAIYELALGLESTSCEWRMAEDGDLTFSVKALSPASSPWCRQSHRDGHRSASAGARFWRYLISELVAGGGLGRKVRIMIDVCGECGVPLMVSEGQRWEDNGVITLAISPRNRMVFYESDNIDYLFRKIGELIGMPIEHIVIESRRRETRRYIERVYSASLKEAVEMTRDGLREGELPPESALRQGLLETAREINLSINNIGRVYGYGDIALSEGWESGEAFPWRTQIIRRPYSIFFYAADMLGSVEAIEDDDHVVEYELVAPDVYKVTSRPGAHSIELMEMLRRKKYDFKPGDVEFERCSSCGAPGAVGRCSWNLEEGTIYDGFTGRRMAIFGPLSMDAILNDLEAELGEAIPEAVVEAQRKYIVDRVSQENWRRKAPDFKELIALRGLGNLTLFEGDARRLEVRVENSVLPLLMVGTTQGMFELAMGKQRSSCEWSLSDDGDLNIVVSE